MSEAPNLRSAAVTATLGGDFDHSRNLRPRRTLPADAARVVSPASQGRVTPYIAPHQRLEELAAFVALLRAQPIPADHLATIAEEMGSAVELVRQLRAGEWPAWLGP